MKTKLLMALGFIGLLLSSCSSDPHEDSRYNTHGDTFTINLKMEQLTRGVTRATVDPVGDEENVNSLYLLFFSPSSDRSGQYEGNIKINGPLLMNTDIRVDMSGSGLNATDAYKILAVANIEEYAPYLGVSVNEWLNNLQGMTENNVYKKIFAYIEADEKIDMDKIIMTGETEKASGGVSTIALTLTRGVARFDVVNSARATYDLISVSIWNAFPETSMFGGGLVDYSKGRIQRFYGLTNTTDSSLPDPGDGNGGVYGDMFGGLYSFPNQVISPAAKDTKTTCLIVGLTRRGESGVTYHRVNISSEDGMQNIKRNGAYRLTINSVSGDGAGSEMEAYTGGVNNINFKINYWDLDDDGLIQQNGNIILGIPTKRIRIGAEQDERTYDIFAFGGAPNEQIVVSTAFDGTAGNHIRVTQNGNTITVNADAITSDEERTGTITITYGGLTATIAVIQSGTASKFLRVTTPSGKGIPPYPGFAGAPMDGTVSVEASGTWKAEIFQIGAGDYFSFNQLAPSSVYNSSDLNGELKIYTIAENTTGNSRQAFVLVTLDADGDNYNSAILLSQRTLGSVDLSPSLQQIDWNGLGKLTTPGGATDTNFRFNVITVKDDVTGKYEAWTALLTEGSTYFEIVSSNHDEDVLANNYVVVRAKGEITDATQLGKLRVQLASFSGTGVDVVLKQTGYTMGVSPDIFSSISNKGGSTGAISVTSNGTTLTWTAEVVSTIAASGTLTDEHVATIVDATSGIALPGGYKYGLTQKFKVKFPKVMYGDHLKGDITANVSVKLWSGDNQVGEKMLSITQNELSPNNVVISNYHGIDFLYGNLYTPTGHFTKAWRNFITELFSTSGEQIAAYPATKTVSKVYTPNAVTLPSAATTVNPAPSSTTYLHSSQGNAITASQQTTINNWRKQDNGVLVSMIDLSVPANSSSFFYPLKDLGYKSAGDAYIASALTARSGSDKKIRDFIYNKGPFGAVGNDASMSFSSDGSSQSVDITGVSGAVALVGADNRASVFIDPVNRIVFFGENQFFSLVDYPNIDVNTNLLDAKARLLANIAAYTILTAQYGSNFSDLFIE